MLHICAIHHRIQKTAKIAVYICVIHMCYNCILHDTHMFYTSQDQKAGQDSSIQQKLCYTSSSPVGSRKHRNQRGELRFARASASSKGHRRPVICISTKYNLHPAQFQELGGGHRFEGMDGWGQGQSCWPTTDATTTWTITT